MNAEAVETFARVAVALTLLASYKIGRGGGFHRARQRIARAVKPMRHRTRNSGGRGSSPSPGPASKKNPRSARERRRAWLREAATALWIALLLFAVVYATLRGESAFADLEGARLLAAF
jgi:hypothetical protein